MENNYEIIWNEEEHYFFETFEEAEEEYYNMVGEYDEIIQSGQVGKDFLWSIVASEDKEDSIYLFPISRC